MYGVDFEDIVPATISIQEAKLALIGVKSDYLDANVWQFDDGSVMQWDDSINME